MLEVKFQQLLLTFPFSHCCFDIDKSSIILLLVFSCQTSCPMDGNSHHCHGRIDMPYPTQHTEQIHTNSSVLEKAKIYNSFVRHFLLLLIHSKFCFLYSAGFNSALTSFRTVITFGSVMIDWTWPSGFSSRQEFLHKEKAVTVLWLKYWLWNWHGIVRLCPFFPENIRCTLRLRTQSESQYVAGWTFYQTFHLLLDGPVGSLPKTFNIWSPCLSVM